jgi:hypothetical protein
MPSRAGADRPQGGTEARLSDIGGPGAAFLGAQALVEYGALSALLRDGTQALQRAGGWAASHPLIIAGALAVGIVLAFRKR